MEVAENRPVFHLAEVAENWPQLGWVGLAMATGPEA